jgi:hypothetical protein
LRNLLIEAANELQVSEFEIFMQAWENYFNSLPDTHIVETQFGAYITERVSMPYYVQHYLTSLQWVPPGADGEIEA